MLSFPHHAPSPWPRRFLLPVARLITSKHLLDKGRRRKKRVFLASSSESGAVVPEGSKFSITYPENCHLVPCPSTTASPRIEHLVVLEGGSVSEYISKALELPPLYVADLIRIGAVYYALVPPKPPPTATLEQIRLYEQFTAPEFLKERHSMKRKTLREAQKTFRITHVDAYVEPGTYLRVYVHPRRFPRCYEVDWRSRIIAIADSYVVLDKPSGTSVGGTSNNIEESCATFATRALGLVDPLRTTHQIDNCTEGCVVLARTKEYCSFFHGQIREGKVNKLYLALAAAPVPVGVITHYMRRFSIPPRLISAGNHVQLADCTFGLGSYMDANNRGKATHVPHVWSSSNLWCFSVPHLTRI
ncbi:hypothetical protein Ancab_033511 [Ancistrocladus abbreviatus]